QTSRQLSQRTIFAISGKKRKRVSTEGSSKVFIRCQLHSATSTMEQESQRRRTRCAPRSYGKHLSFMPPEDTARPHLEMSSTSLALRPNTARNSIQTFLDASCAPLFTWA